MKKHRLPLSLTALLLTLVLILSPCTAFSMSKDNQVLNDLTTCTQWPSGPEVDAQGAILIDARTGNVLYEKNAYTPMYPASITKLMTALLTLENCQLTDTVTFSYRATHELEPGATSIARTEGEEMSVQDCLYALLMMSANEVAQGLAEHVGGSLEGFADMMNARAKELGCTDTHFVTASGLHDDDHTTTAHDMAIILRACIQDPTFMELESQMTYVIPPTNKHAEETPLAQKHKLLRSGADHYEGALAGKTGYTTTAGHSLATYAVRGDMELICIVMEGTGKHYEDTRALFDFGFSHINCVHASESREIVALARTAVMDVLPYTADELSDTYLDDEVWLDLPTDLPMVSLQASAEMLPANASDGEGVPVATITYSLNDNVVGTVTLKSPTALAAPAAAETETEETEEAPEPSGTGFAATAKKLLRKAASLLYHGLLLLGAKVYGLAMFFSPSHLKELYQANKLMFVGTIAAFIAIVILLFLLIRRISGAAAKRRQKKNRYIEPRNPQPRQSQKRDEEIRRIRRPRGKGRS